MKISTTGEAFLPEVEFDDYIPFSARYREPVQTATGYWNISPDRSTLLEFKLDMESGVIRGITLTNLPRTRFVFKSDEPSQAALPVAQGRPYLADFRNQVSPGAPKARTVIIEEESPLFLTVYANSLNLQIGENSEALSSYVESGRLRFGLSEKGDLVCIEVSSLSALEKRKLLTALH